jgi:hypothetical protein
VDKDGQANWSMQTNRLMRVVEKAVEVKSLLVRQTRFERATPAFGGLYSIHLSYWRYEKYKKRGVFYRNLLRSSLAILGYFVDLFFK